MWRGSQRNTLVLPALWLLGTALLAMLLFSASTNVGLRSRSLFSVAERLEQAGREREVRWLLDARQDLSLATAALRTVASLVLVLDVVEICEHYDPSHVVRNVVAFVAAFALILVFGVVLPAAIAKYAAGALIAGVLPALKLLRLVSLPMLRSLDAVDGLTRRVLGAPLPTPESEADEVEKEILNVISEGKLQGAVDEQETEMIRSVIEFGDTNVAEIMTPRTDIIAIEKGANLSKAKETITDSGHSRVPVYDETIDNILGVLYAKDLLLLDNGDEFDLTKLMRAVPYIPDNKPVDDLLQELKDQKVHIAIVLDEYGGTSGLVTIEDIIEELVGEIADEYELVEPPPPIMHVDANTIDVDARMRIDELNEELHLTLPEHDDYDTIGGFVFSSMGKIPRVGEQCEHKNIRISVLAAEPRRINRLRLHVTVNAAGRSRPDGS